MDAVAVAEYMLTRYIVEIRPRWPSLWNSELTENMEQIKAAVMEINEKKLEVKEISTAGKNLSIGSAQALLVPTSNDTMVGFEAEMKLVRERLVSHRKKLDVISIVGMPGLGKTTLARKIYEDPHTNNYFDARAWCCVSQEYNKKEVLHTILGSLIQLTNETTRQSESELSVVLHKQLKGRRYLIVLDDIWDVNAFIELKCFFPDDNKGSRIMLTSRSKQIGLETNFFSDLIEPALLTDEQSWELLERNVYTKGKCPSELCKIGQEIARRCKGLPLAVVVVGGVLTKGTQKLEFWEQVAGNLSSYRARDSQSQYMAALELSYKYLPNFLKPMFLYLGAFPEDMEIPADKLMQLWIAKGFVQQTESTSLEIQAETYLTDLIDRSLVMVVKRKWDGRVKRCHVHDLLRDMCLAKAKEENFMKHEQAHIKLPDTTIYQQLPDPIMYQQRLSILSKGFGETTSRNLVACKDLTNFSISPPIYSLLYFYVGPYEQNAEHLPTVISCLKLLKVFEADIFEITEDDLDKNLFKLVHLRYLSISVGALWYIPWSISNLRNLETLIIQKRDSDRSISVPETIWEMTKLRHLHIRGCLFKFEHVNSFTLEKLETLSTPIIYAREEEELFRKVPSLKKLRCALPFFYHGCPNFESLSKLESLNVTWPYDAHAKCMEWTGEIKLPLTLKNLSIYGVRLKWNQVSTLHALPNLEALKLKYKSVEDEVWDIGEDDVFANLKFLMLRNLDIKRWSASSDNFPSLEKLVLDCCWKLTEIPSDLGDIYTLREFNLMNCSTETANMAKQILEEQVECCNDQLKFYF